MSVFTLCYIWHNQYLDQEHKLTGSWAQLVNKLNATSQVENTVGLLRHQFSSLQEKQYGLTNNSNFVVFGNLKWKCVILN